MKRTNVTTIMSIMVGTLYTLPAYAQSQVIPPDPDPIRVANTPEPDGKSDWDVRAGIGVVASPSFEGAKTYRVSPLPYVAVRYKDRFFASPLGGVGFDAIKTGGLRAGPVISYAAGRKEDNKGLLAITKRSDALLGLGDVIGGVGVGGYVEYEWQHFSAKAQVTKVLGGYAGLNANLGLRYNTSLPFLSSNGRPATLSIGPRVDFVNDKHNQAFFGVTAAQSAATGLPQYNAKGGLQSYGVGATLQVPVSTHWSGILLAGYNRLAGDAANSPLVRQRGSANQPSIGMGLIYRFGK